MDKSLTEFYIKSLKFADGAIDIYYIFIYMYATYVFTKCSQMEKYQSMCLASNEFEGTFHQNRLNCHFIPIGQVIQRAFQKVTTYLVLLKLMKVEINQC